MRHIAAEGGVVAGPELDQGTLRAGAHPAGGHHEVLDAAGDVRVGLAGGPGSTRTGTGRAVRAGNRRESRLAVKSRGRRDARPLAGPDHADLGRGGSTSWLNGTPSATPSAHRVSTLGLPVPDSSWESVDLATGALGHLGQGHPDPLPFAAQGGGDGGERGPCPACSHVRSSGRSFGLTNAPVSFIIVEHGYVLANTRRGLVRDAAAIGAAVGIIGLSYGAIGVGPGCRPGRSIAMSILVFAGGSQFLAVGMLAAGNPVAAILGGLLLNVRHLPFGLAVGGVLVGPGAGWSPATSSLRDGRVRPRRSGDPRRRRRSLLARRGRCSCVEHRHRSGCCSAARWATRPSSASTPPSRPACSR